MYLHLGQNTVISSKELIGIFDLDNTTVSKQTRDFLKKAQQSGKVRLVSYDLPKSFVITEDKTVFLSPISAATLTDRTERKRSF